MLKIRLQRVGRKSEPAFRIVLTESENSTKSGRLKEVLGSYDARKTSDLLKTDRINYWLKQGAKPTGTVHNLLVTHKVIDAKKINVLPRKSPIAKEAEPTTATPAAEAAPASAVEPSPSPEPTADQGVIESTEATEA
ncbi:30S ribosomal protein S16 [Candidatus Parcubacteria bacterium]|nr:30S ribosomal protein S16 [Candidatus Parcubacteria bacterium]